MLRRWLHAHGLPADRADLLDALHNGIPPARPTARGFGTRGGDRRATSVRRLTLPEHQARAFSPIARPIADGLPPPARSKSAQTWTAAPYSRRRRTSACFNAARSNFGS